MQKALFEVVGAIEIRDKLILDISGRVAEWRGGVRR